MITKNTNTFPFVMKLFSHLITADHSKHIKKTLNQTDEQRGILAVE